MDHPSISEDRDICLHRFEDSRQFNGAIVPPTYSNTLFVYRSFEELAGSDTQKPGHYVYSRGMNPSTEIVERKLAALERGEMCKLFSSGMAAISAAIFNSVKSGDHIVAVGNVYSTTLDMLKYMDKFQVGLTVVYSTDLENLKKAIQPNTALIYIESPTDLVYRLIDLKAVADLAKSLDIRTVIDNTWATPLFQKPLEFGIDIVVHSASKYLGGHSDVMGGVMVASTAIIEQVYAKEYLQQGSIMVPDECMKLLKGLRTLPLRMKTHEENAFKVASFLEGHPKVSKVHYPGLPSHPDFELGRRQMKGYSGLLSFELATTSYKDVCEFINRMKVFQIGVSWGSFESLVWSPNYGRNAQKLKQEHISPGTIRIAAGQGDPEEMIMDLEQALG